eukprot:8772841-Prorocentrum_lima.AAC.1
MHQISPWNMEHLELKSYPRHSKLRQAVLEKQGCLWAAVEVATQSFRRTSLQRVLTQAGCALA